MKRQIKGWTIEGEVDSEGDVEIYITDGHYSASLGAAEGEGSATNTYLEEKEIPIEVIEAAQEMEDELS